MQRLQFSLVGAHPRAVPVTLQSRYHHVGSVLQVPSISTSTSKSTAPHATSLSLPAVHQQAQFTSLPLHEVPLAWICSGIPGPWKRNPSGQNTRLHTGRKYQGKRHEALCQDRAISLLNYKPATNLQNSCSSRQHFLLFKDKEEEVKSSCLYVERT